MKNSIVWLSVFLLLITACVKGDVEIPEEEETSFLSQLDVPPSFTFEMERELSLEITDSSIEEVLYQAFVYNEAVLEQFDSITGPLPSKLFERQLENGQLSTRIVFPLASDSLLLVRRSNNAVEEFLLAANGTSLNFSYPNSTGNKSSHRGITSFKNNECANVYGQEAYVDLDNVIIEKNNGVDAISNIVFPAAGTTASITATSFGNLQLNNPFSVGGNGLSTPVFTVDGFSFWISSQIDSNNEADGYVEFRMQFDSPMSQVLMHYRSIHSSFYEFVGSEHTEVLLSGGTELVYDSNERTLKDSDTGSKARFSRDGYGTVLIQASSGTFTEIVWRRKDDPTSNNQIDTNWFTFTEVPDCADSDGDGVSDSADEFEDDTTISSSTVYPSSSVKATLIYEDLWPFLGDYDFNDTALDYKITEYLNAQGRVVKMDIDYTVTSDGAGFINAFAFGFPGVNQSSISSVSGQQLSRNVFTLEANGAESGQNYAVVPIFDNHSTELGIARKVEITFSSPILKSALGEAPYRPFLVADGNREREIHIIGNEPTSLGNSTPSVNGNNQDSDGNFKTSNGLPWAINVVEAIPMMKEKRPIDQGYNHFVDWAISGGGNYKGWYKNLNGYRNSEALQN